MERFLSPGFRVKPKRVRTCRAKKELDKEQRIIESGRRLELLEPVRSESTSSEDKRPLIELGRRPESTSSEDKRPLIELGNCEAAKNGGYHSPEILFQCMQAGRAGGINNQEILRNKFMQEPY